VSLVTCRIRSCPRDAGTSSAIVSSRCRPATDRALPVPHRRQRDCRQESRYRRSAKPAAPGSSLAEAEKFSSLTCFKDPAASDPAVSSARVATLRRDAGHRGALCGRSLGVPGPAHTETLQPEHHGGAEPLDRQTFLMDQGPCCRHAFHRSLETKAVLCEEGVKIRPAAVKKPLRQASSADSRDALGMW
jgi:hypothetical protein